MIRPRLVRLMSTPKRRGGRHPWRKVKSASEWRQTYRAIVAWYFRRYKSEYERWAVFKLECGN